MKPRKLLLLLAALLLALAVLPGVNAQGGRSDETITVATDLEPNSLDPLFGDAIGGPDRYTYNLMYETLIRLEQDGSLTPMLAESYEVSEDGTMLTFTLREGVTFHDGTPFNAEAAAFNLNRALDPEVNAPRGADLTVIESVEATDEMTLVITLANPSATIFTNLATEAGMMISPTAWQTLGEDYGRNPVGTGPFRFVEWRSGDRLIVERFEDYWRMDAAGVPLPYLAGVTMRFISDPAVKLVELQTGNVALTDAINPIDFEIVEDDPDLQLILVPSGIHQWMTFNVTQPPFDDVTLRRAILHAIDRQLLSDVITFGTGEVTPTIVPSFWWVYEPELEDYDYDPEQARQLLAEAGYPDGIDVTMSIIQREPDTQIAELLQATLAEFNINIEIEVLERQAWIDKVLAYDYEMAMLRAGVPRPDPDFLFGTVFGRGAANNWSGGQNEELFGIIDEAATVRDRDARRELYVRAQEIILADAFYGFLFFRPVAFPASDALQNFTMDVDGGWRLGEVWLSE
ncbi:MAG: ABC transporter substrate-binding protein [Anaerolineae bacterium]|nr:ABC transporter substrate-binding protein [Anaerolineae bacterium]